MMSDQTTGNMGYGQIVPGTAVYDVNGDKVGTVGDQSAQGQYLIVEKGWLFPKDLYIPTSAIARSDADGIYLNVYKDDLSDARYEQPGDMVSTGGTLVGGGPTQVNVTTGTASTAAQTTTGTVQTNNVQTDDVRVPLREEQLVVGKQQEEVGRVRLHKDVVEEQQTVPVQLQHEQVTVERVPVSGQVDATTTGDAFTEEDIDVPVMGEEAVVGKQVRGVEEVRLHKDVFTEQQQVGDTVRKERVTVDGQDVDTLNTTTGNQNL